MRLLCKNRFRQAVVLKEILKMSDNKVNSQYVMNGTEKKSPFLIGVAGGTASGKVMQYDK